MSLGNWPTALTMETKTRNGETNMSIEMSHEEFYFDGGYDLLTTEGVKSLENATDLLCRWPDDSWIEADGMITPKVQENKGRNRLFGSIR